LQIYSQTRAQERRKKISERKDENRTRSVDVVTMEKDLESQVEALLSRLLTEQLVSPAGKQALTRWFIDRLETERRGWKGRLRDASRATDSEHRLALASQAIIQRVNERMKQRLEPPARRRPDDATAEGSGGGGDDDDDVDKRMERLQVIERNWDKASRYIDKLERDRTDCLQVRFPSLRFVCVYCIAAQTPPVRFIADW